FDPMLSIEQQQRYDEKKGEYRQQIWRNGLRFRGSLGEYFAFRFSLRDNHVQDGRWENQRVPLEVLQESGWPYLTRGENGKVDYDENLAVLTFTHKYFYVVYGREYNEWGFGRKGNLLLSTNAPLYDQIKMVIRYWKFKFTHLTAFLQYISPIGRVAMKQQPYMDVFWSGNRLELQVGGGLQLGFSEAILYGDRSLQPGYLHPLAFFKSMEHFYGDRDNGLLGLDFEWRLWPGWKIYGEWLIDDITTGKVGSDFYGNKFGWQAGFLAVNPLGIPDVDILLEYTRIKPYVYSQSFQDYNKYKHYDTVLGHEIGPNSDDWVLRVQKRFSRFLQLSAELEQYRHGANLPGMNAGGDPDRPFGSGDDKNAPFLAGERNWQTAWGVSLEYEAVRNLQLYLQYRRFQFNHTEWLDLYAFRLSLNFGDRPEPIPSVFPLAY
ncbi:MAG: capsule assembly Wzi family protein, partial [Calditrichia bacterium]